MSEPDEKIPCCCKFDKCKIFCTEKTLKSAFTRIRSAFFFAFLPPFWHGYIRDLQDILQLCTEHILKPKFTLIRNGSILCFWVFLQGYIRHVRDILQLYSLWSYLQLGRSMSRHKEDEQMLTSLDIPLSFTVLILGKLYYVWASQFSFSFSDRKGK